MPSRVVKSPTSKRSRETDIDLEDRRKQRSDGKEVRGGGKGLNEGSPRRIRASANYSMNCAVKQSSISARSGLPNSWQIRYARFASNRISANYSIRFVSPPPPLPIIVRQSTQRRGASRPEQDRVQKLTRHSGGGDGSRNGCIIRT